MTSEVISPNYLTMFISSSSLSPSLLLLLLLLLPLMLLRFSSLTPLVIFFQHNCSKITIIA